MIQPSAREHRLRVGAIEIVFVWGGDRWSHRVEIHGGEVASVIESVEGTADAEGSDAWPASPPLTELAPVPGTTAIVGIGRAGRSHYSVSFRAVRPEGGPGGPAGDEVLVEAACRIHEVPAWLGSAYRAADGSPIRIAARFGDDGSTAALPRTVTWSYRIGLPGILPSPPSSEGKRDA